MPNTPFLNLLRRFQIYCVPLLKCQVLYILIGFSSCKFLKNYFIFNCLLWNNDVKIMASEGLEIRLKMTRQVSDHFHIIMKLRCDPTPTAHNLFSRCKSELIKLSDYLFVLSFCSGTRVELSLLWSGGHRLISSLSNKLLDTLPS